MAQRNRREPAPNADKPRQAASRDALLVTGLPGSGKTTMVNSPHFPRDIAAPITFSDLMDEVLRDSHPGTSLAQLWPLERERVQRAAAERLAAYRPDRLLVIDGHLIVPTPRGWERSVPPEVWTMISMISIIIVHVPVNEMVRRHGPALSPAELEHRTEELSIRQNVVQATATYYAAWLNRRSVYSTAGPPGQACALHWIVNAEGRREAAEQDLADYIRLVAPPR
jgi:adenylate kinase